MRLRYFGFAFLVLGVASAPAKKDLFSNDCNVEGLSNIDFMTYYVNKDSFQEDYSGVVAEFPSTGITGVYIEKGTYLDVSIKEDKIIIETTEDFVNFQNDSGPIYGSIEFDTTIVFECENGTSSLRFHQKVIDTNNEDPYFNKKSFEIKFGMSLIQGFELSKYITIVGMDNDLTSGQVKFDISGDTLAITPSGSVDRGMLAKITLLKDIDMPFDHEFEITVTDGGLEPFRSTKAKLRLLLVENEEPVVSPLFVKPLWFWKYDTAQNSISATEEVSLSQGFDTGLNVKQIGFEDYFETKLGDDPAKKEVKIELKKALSEEIVKEKRIFLNLQAELPEAKQIAKTVVMIEMV